jgi:hypothetical protein
MPLVGFETVNPASNKRMQINTFNSATSGIGNFSR